MIVASGYSLEYIEDMPFSDAIAIYEFWSRVSPSYSAPSATTGTRPESESVNPLESAEAVRLLAGKGRPAKLSTAPEKDRLRFEQLKETAKKLAAEKRGKKHAG